MALLKEETNFRIECTNGQFLQDVVQECRSTNPSLYSHLHIAEVYPELSTDDVLVEEYIDGVPLLDTVHALKVPLNSCLDTTTSRLSLGPHARNDAWTAWLLWAVDLERGSVSL